MIASAVIFVGSLAPSAQQFISDQFPSLLKDINWLASVSAALFLGFVIWSLWDLSVKLQKFEDDYHYALSFDGLESIPDPQGLHIAMILSNTIDKPLEFKLDMANTYIEIEGKRITPSAPSDKWKSTEGILYKSKPQRYIFPPYIPLKDIAHGRLHYELEYGRPKNPLFRHIREIGLTLQRFSPHDVRQFITLDEHEDIPIKEPKPVKRFSTP